MSENKILISCLTVMIINWVAMSYIVHEKSNEIEALIIAHENELQHLNNKIDEKDEEIKEMNETMGLLFMESSNVTNSYNELKKKCKGKK